MDRPVDAATPLIFDLDEHGDLGRRVARRTDGELGDHELRRFSDDELKIRPLETVRGRNVYVAQPLPTASSSRTPRTARPSPPR